MSALGIGPSYEGIHDDLTALVGNDKNTECVVRSISSAPSLRARRVRELDALLQVRQHLRQETASKEKYTVVGRSRPVLISHRGSSVISRDNNVDSWAAPVTRAIQTVVFLIGLSALVILGLSLGNMLSPGAYDGPTFNYSVRSGQSLWALAEQIESSRPIEEIMEDIRSINSLGNDRIFTGQVLELPAQ